MKKLIAVFAFFISMLYFANIGFCLDTPFALSPTNGASFTKGGGGITLEVAGTNGASYIEYYIDNHQGFGSPEIGYSKSTSPNYTGNDGIVAVGSNFVITLSLQNLLPQNVYYWKARLLDANKKDISKWTTERGEKWFDLMDPVTEPRACKVDSISPTSKYFTYCSNSGTIAVNIDPDDKNCSWTSASNNSWISITSGSNGTGDGTVNYSVAENTGASSRTGTISIGITDSDSKQTFTITQDGKPEDNPPPPTYSYEWKKSSWSGCDTECGSGQKTRTVWCERNDGQQVSDSYCSQNGAKPDNSESCFIFCPPTVSITLLSPNPANEGECVFFSGQGSDPDGGDVSYKWISSLDGELSSDSSFFSYSLTVGEHIITLQIMDDEGESANAQGALTIDAKDQGHTATELKDEQIVSASIGKDEEQLYFIDVPDTATAVIVKTEGTSGGKVDLYLKYGSAPTVDFYDIKSALTDRDEQIRIDNLNADSASKEKTDRLTPLVAGHYYVLVKAQGNGGNYKLKARYLELRFPFVESYLITQEYKEGETDPNNYSHKGNIKYALDFAAGNCYGHPVVAMEDGRISFIQFVSTQTKTGHGRRVGIDHGDGYATYVSHLSTVTVRKGIPIQKGQEFGNVGNNGNSSGPHIHCDLWKDGVSCIPEAMGGKKDFKKHQTHTGDPVQNPETFIIIDETQASKQGVAAWNEVKNQRLGYMNTMSWVAGAGINSPASASINWTPNIKEAGNYVVYAHIPNLNATASAKYSIIHDGVTEIKTVEQANFDSEWVMLSNKNGWYFEKGADGYVQLDNGNNPVEKRVGFDAVMFTSPEYGSGGGADDPNSGFISDPNAVETSPSPSILKNWNFEDSDSLDNWEIENGNCKGVFTATIDPNGGRDGGKCLVIFTAEKQTNYYDAQVKQTGIELQNGVEMTINFWAASDKEYPALIEVCRNAAPYYGFSANSQYFLITQGWREYTAFFILINDPEESPAEERKFSINVGAGTGTLWIDDLKFQTSTLFKDSNQTDPGTVITPEPEPPAEETEPPAVEPEPPADTDPPIVEPAPNPPAEDAEPPAVEPAPPVETKPPTVEPAPPANETDPPTVEPEPNNPEADPNSAAKAIRDALGQCFITTVKIFK